MEEHTIVPFIYPSAKVLILGSFPSVKSRERDFYYMHPQNRFYKVLSHLFKEDFYDASVEMKKKLLKKHHIALFDVVKRCNIKGSSDAHIKDVVPNDIEQLINNSHISKIFVNGNQAFKLMKKYHPNIEITLLPSTSPANAAFSLERLCELWKIIID